MSGNVWEWCWDMVGTSNRRFRGGSSIRAADDCAVSYRGPDFPHDDRYGDRGFRLARSLRF